MAKKSATFIQVDRTDSRYYVVVCFGDERDNDGVYDTRAKAEQRAEVLAKIHGCDWGTNY